MLSFSCTARTLYIQISHPGPQNKGCSWQCGICFASCVPQHKVRGQYYEQVSLQLWKFSHLKQQSQSSHEIDYVTQNETDSHHIFLLFFVTFFLLKCEIGLALIYLNLLNKFLENIFFQYLMLRDTKETGLHWQEEGLFALKNILLGLF